MKIAAVTHVRYIVDNVEKESSATLEREQDYLVLYVQDYNIVITPKSFPKITNQIHEFDAVTIQFDSLGEAETFERNYRAFSPSPTLEDLRMSMAEFASERDWDKYHTPRNLIMAMTGEVGELAEIFQWCGELSMEDVRNWDEKRREHLGEEISDVLLYLIRLADRCSIDLPKVAKDKIRKNGIKYPSKKVYGKSDKYTVYLDDGKEKPNEI
jgi:dCTP diphosphatase